jgi:hypothetical protein
VTDKVDPNDIDFVSFLLQEEIDALAPPDRAAMELLFRGPETPWGGWCQAFLVPVADPGTPGETATIALRAYFLQLFGHTKPEEGGRPKGIVRIERQAPA